MRIVKNGPFTMVGHGVVVAKSFPESYCVLVGAPASFMRTLYPGNYPRHKSQNECHGFIPNPKFRIRGVSAS